MWGIKENIAHKLITLLQLLKFLSTSLNFLKQV